MLPVLLDQVTEAGRNPRHSMCQDRSGRLPPCRWRFIATCEAICLALLGIYGPSELALQHLGAKETAKCPRASSITTLGTEACHKIPEAL